MSPYQSMVPGLRIPHSENAKIVWIEVWIWGRERTGSLLISSAVISFFASLHQDLTSCWSQSRLHSQPFKNDNAYALLPRKPSSPLRSPTSYNHLLLHSFSFATARSPRIGKDEERLVPLTRVVLDQEAGHLRVSPLPQGQEVPRRRELPSTHTLPGSNQRQLQNQRKQKNHIEQQTTLRKRWINTLKTDIQ